LADPCGCGGGPLGRAEIEIDLSGGVAMAWRPNRDIREMIAVDITGWSDLGPEIVLGGFSRHGPARTLGRRGTAVEQDKDQEACDRDPMFQKNSFGFE